MTNLIQDIIQLFPFLPPKKFPPFFIFSFLQIIFFSLMVYYYDYDYDYYYFHKVMGLEDEML